MRRYSPILFYIAFLVTGGLFVFYWIYSLMSDVNALYKRGVFRARLIAFSYSALFLAVMALLWTDSFFDGHALLLPLFLGLVFFIEFVVLFLLPVLIFVRITNFEQKPRGPFSVLFISLGMMFFGISLPYLQYRINRNWNDDKGRQQL